MKLFNRAIDIHRSDGTVCLLLSTGKFIWRNTIEKCWKIYRNKKYRLKYGSAAPDSNELIYVNPKNIEYMIVPALRYEYPRTGTYVLNGDWDERPICTDYFSTKEFKQENNEPALLPFSEYGLYRSIERRYEDNVSWEDTEWYQYYISNLEDTQYNSVEEVNEKFKAIDELYEKIESEGYKTQRELNESSETKLTLSDSMDEILIDIGRNGQLLFEDGRHRLAIAKVMELEEIPVKILVRHTEWQKLRSRIASQETEFHTQNQSNISRTHPDIQQL